MHWLLAIHVMAVISWMAALFYLPRLFVYHCQSQSEESNQRFKVMEKKLFYVISVPAAVIAIITGMWIMYGYTLKTYHHIWWLHIKLIAVFFLVLFHATCWKYMRDFMNDRNKHSEKFFRYFNEIPTTLMIIIVIMVVVKPF